MPNGSPMTNGSNGGLTKPLTETVRALSGTPMLLVLLVLNMMILGMITYLLKVRAEQMQLERREIITLLQDCLRRVEPGGQPMH